ncbi:glutamine synthetase III [Ruminococcaceae bacterium OttesenSCG-928-A16]|nr:glutamine synthetase III [Ruminococcaceae bacterium OttesenSCG-928-A16]
METQNVFKRFGRLCFDDQTMQERIPKTVYQQLHKMREEGLAWVPEVADVVAEAMKDWAIEHGATHYIHWFTPMTGASAGKHDSFIDNVKNGEPIVRFSGKLLSKGESDASSFPSGGLRTTFEARGYTTWDPTSPAFVLGTTLYIPTAFCGYNGEALDQKTPVLRSMQVLNKQALRVLRALGDTESVSVRPTVGAEQEYFLVDKQLLDKRLDLKVCGYTLSGARPPKGQELEDHYYGSMSERVRNFMRELDEELWQIGVPAKTEHNEVAPGQYELANIYACANIALDHNQITMELMRKVALRHGFACLLHEKPFEGINGSGKHNNWSLITSTGLNLLEPTENPVENLPFLITLCAVIAAVDEHADLLRLSTACPGNDLRLGANEAPPAIISIFLGDPLTRLLQSLAEGHAYEMGNRSHLRTGVKGLPRFTLDDNDRNRTSPFAFTGNKFEFRMVGSSQSIGLANTVLCAIVADKMHDFADKLEHAENVEAVVAEIVHDTWEAHSKVIFNGNNYSAEWREEAARRGLPDIPTMVDAAGAFVSEKNMALFERTKVFNRSECSSRYEVLLEAYIKPTRIAVATLLELTRRSYLPAACSYLNSITQLQAGAQQLQISCAYPAEVAQKLAASIDNCAAAATAAEVALANIPLTLAAPEAACQMQRLESEEMATLRSCCNTLETLMPEDFWPVPGYSALLYDV